MALDLIFSIVIIIVIFGLLFWITKKIWKTLLLGVIIIIILLAIFGFLIYKDVKDISGNIGNKDNLFIIKDENKFLLGFKINLDEINNIIKSNDLNQGLSKVLIPDDKLKLYNTEDKDKILSEGYYKIVLIDLKAFESIEKQEITIDKFSLLKSDAIAALKSDDPYPIIISSYMKTKNLPSEQKSLVENQFPIDKNIIKPSISMILIKEYLENNPMNIIKDFKKGNIQIYKETITFKLIKGSFGDIASNYMQKALNK